LGICKKRPPFTAAAVWKREGLPSSAVLLIVLMFI
jgi:hypothetical protein